MVSVTVELYNALVRAGVEKEKAQRVADEIVTKEDATHFATKADTESVRVEVKESEARMQRFIFTALVTQAVFVIGLNASLVVALITFAQ